MTTRPAATTSRSTATRQRRRRRRRLARLAGLGAALLGVVVVIAGLVAWLRPDRPDVGLPIVERCRASADGVEQTLTPEQADNAALIVATAVRRALPARAATIAIATGLQESRLINVEYGDRDSLGLFQQRPSQGWGTAEQVQDPVYSTNAFYDALAKVAGYETMDVTKAAQSVQRSAFPDAYAQHEDRARAWASALTGFSPAALTCTLRPVAHPGTTAALTERVQRDLGALPVTVRGGAVSIDATALAPADASRAAWAAGEWAVAVADATGATSVQVGDRIWSRAHPTWRVAPAASGTAGRDAKATGAGGATPAPAPGHVRVTVAVAPGSPSP